MNLLCTGSVDLSLQFVCGFLQSAELISKAVDELRKSLDHRPGLFIACRKVKGLMVNRFVASRAANVAELLKPRREMQRGYLPGEVGTLASDIVNQPFESNPEHGCGSAGRDSANALGFQENGLDVLRHAVNRSHPGAGRVNHLSLEPHRRSAAVCAGLDQVNVAIKKLKKIPRGSFNEIRVKEISPKLLCAFVGSDNRVILKLADNTAMRAAKALVVV